MVKVSSTVFKLNFGSSETKSVDNQALYHINYNNEKDAVILIQLCNESLLPKTHTDIVFVCFCPPASKCNLYSPDLS